MLSFHVIVSLIGIVSGIVVLFGMLEHDAEKWVPVFGKTSCSSNILEGDGDSKKSHHALGARRMAGLTAVFLVTTVLTSITDFLLPAEHRRPNMRDPAC